MTEMKKKSDILTDDIEMDAGLNEEISDADEEPEEATVLDEETKADNKGSDR